MASIDKFKTESGKQRYRARYAYYTNGKRVQKTRTFETAKDANAFLAKIEHSINTGMYADAHGLTVGEYLDLWLDTYAVNVRPNSRKGYQVCADLHIKPYIGGTRLESLSTLAIQHMYGEILKTEYRPAEYEQRGAARICVKPAKTYSIKTVRNIHALLHLCLDQARREGLIAKNPADDAKLPTAKAKEYTIPTPEQMKRLLDELSGAECFLAILTCAVMGCRRGEALGLYWQDIDFEASTIELKRALIINNFTNKVEIGELKTKTSRRILPMPDILRAELLKVKREREEAARGAGKHVVSSPFVFTTIRGKPFRPDSISQAFKRAAVKVGLPGMRLHDLRHTAITYMLEAGENPKTVSEFAGHATAQFTMNQYAHVLDQSKKKASDALMGTLFSK
jgi:integrase